MNKKSNRFSPEMRERAVRMVQEHRGEYPSLWAAIESIAPKVGCVPPAQVLRAFVDQHRDTFGVEPICKALQLAPSAYLLHARRQRIPTLQSDRAKRDSILVPQIKRVWDSNWQVYGARQGLETNEP